MICSRPIFPTHWGKPKKLSRVLLVSTTGCSFIIFLVMSFYEDTLKKLSTINFLSSNDVRGFATLMKRGLSANEDLYGSLPIHEVSRYGYVDFLEFLLEHGAAIDIEDGLGRTAAMICAEHGQVACLRLLVDREALIDRRVFESAMGCDDEDRVEAIKAYAQAELAPRIAWKPRVGLLLAHKHRRIRLPLPLLKEVAQYLV